MVQHRAADDGDGSGSGWDEPDVGGGPDHEVPRVDARDTPAEVDAAFRTLRRSAAGYFVVFLLVVGAFPALSLTLDWWSDSRLLGTVSPGFAAAAIGLYVAFVIIAIAATGLTTAVEDRMLGTGGSSTGDQPSRTDEP